MWESRRPPLFQEDTLFHFDSGCLCYNIILFSALYMSMQWTDRIRQIKIILVFAAVIIAVASLLVSHFEAGYAETGESIRAISKARL